MIEPELKNWLIKALNDYKTAKQLAQAPPEEMITDTLCFHCQQFVEKALKAYLYSHKVDFGRVHNLEYLVTLCTEIDSDFDRLYDAAKMLSDFAVQVRYPDDFYIPSVNEARQCLDMTTKSKEFIFGNMDVDEEEVDA